MSQLTGHQASRVILCLRRCLCFSSFVAFFVTNSFFKTKMIYSTEQKAFIRQKVTFVTVVTLMFAKISISVSTSCRLLSIISGVFIRS
jgi:hypothetical protein